MKMMTHLNHIELQANLDSESIESTSYQRPHYNNDLGEQITPAQLVACINAQFDQIYKENHKRKYLLKELSSYLSK